MNNFRKAGTLIVTLMVPAFAYIMLRACTQNHYTLPRYIPVIDSTNGSPVMHSITGLNGETQQDTLYRHVPGFSLIDQDSQAVDQTIIKGKIHVADFFFTRCGTICPILQSSLSRVQEIFKERDDLAFLSYSVDPENDKPKQLKAYAKKVGAKAGTWYFLTGDKAQIYNLAQRGYFLPVVDHGVSYGKPDETFIHSEKLVLVDKEGIIRGFYDGTDKKDVDRLIAEIRVLFDIYSKQT
ncbi:SCO family protein [Fibrella aestuarina]|uniref:SCO family protein n=2 Tax=Fibrivirga algicola TaxID=2950420 RepID=A0ABX0QDZ1_9BACT|nr:electron transporter SenC [Fibrella sp. ES10-3-2-2]NID10399.1 SCO family protein [Fibrivirga algicola]